MLRPLAHPRREAAQQSGELRRFGRGVNARRRRSCARRDSVPRSAMGIQSVAIERCSDLAQPLCAQLAPVRELVVSIPAPR